MIIILHITLYTVLTLDAKSLSIIILHASSITTILSLSQEQECYTYVHVSLKRRVVKWTNPCQIYKLECGIVEK